MKGLVITSKGIEDIASMEISELINAKCKTDNCCVVFDFKEFSDLCLLCYKCQSADRVLHLIGYFEFSNFFDDLKKFINDVNLNEWTSNYKKFKVECIRIGTHNFNSVDAGKKVAEFILKKYNKIKVDIKNPDITFLVYIVDGKCYLGVDFAGFELNKRSYKIFLHPNSLRGTIAYALARESGLDKKDVMLDPFSRDGVIAIETAFYMHGFPNNYYKKDRFAFLKLKIGVDFEKFFNDIDKIIKKPKSKIYSFDHLFKYVDYSRKNAKIAGVEKFINFSRVELEWLDIKFKKESVDRIITSPVISKNANLEKIYNEFFYQCEYILNNKGTIAIISRIPDFVKKHAEKHSFIVAKEKGVWSGEQLLTIMIFKKKNI